MEARQLAQGDPQLTLPLQQIDLLVVPGHQTARWLMIGPRRTVAQRRQGHMAEPAAQMTVLRMREAPQRPLHA